MAASDSVVITYVPAECGSMIPGKSKAPQSFQDVGLAQKLRDCHIPSVLEQYALESPAIWSAATFAPGGVRNEDLNLLVCQNVYNTVRQSLTTDPNLPAFQLIIGGECCMLPAILSAFWHRWDKDAAGPDVKRVGLLYIDADTDLSSPTDANSIGTFAGMNMTHLVRSAGALDSMTQFSRPSGEPVCDSSNTVLFGTNMSLASNTRNHFAYLFDHDYKVVSSASIAREPERRAQDALKYLEDRVDIILVHLDVDAIDARMFPLANVPNFTGVAFEQMMRALKVFLNSGKVGGLVVAEVNPDHDPSLEMVKGLTSHIVEMLAGRMVR